MIPVYFRGLGGLVVTNSAAGAKGPRFNSPVARSYLRFNSRACTWQASSVVAMRCTVAHKLLPYYAV